MRQIIAAVLILVPFAAFAQTLDVMGAIRARDWPAAEASARTSPDPVVGKLVTFYRLLTPGAATAEEIAAFQEANSDWPQQAALSRRRDLALAAMADDAAAAAFCAQHPPAQPPALLRCAEAAQHTGNGAGNVGDWVRQAWASGDASIEPKVLARFAGSLTPQANWQRFDRLAVTDPAAAQSQIARLELAARPKAEARLALKRDAPNAAALLAALPAAQRAEPGVFLEQAQWLRRAAKDDEALALWLSVGPEAERAAAPDRLPAFWAERSTLARRRLRAGDVQGAYQLAAGHQQQAADQAAEAEFLAGFLALRKLNDSDLARAHFQRLAESGKAALTQSRAHYWLGRAGGGAAEYEKAAAYPTTYYGQLALLALGRDPAARIREVRDSLQIPPDQAERVLALSGREVARAAAYLTAWGEKQRAQPFLFRLDEIAPDVSDRLLVARLAQGLGTPDTAIWLARRAGRDGVVEVATGWPAAATIPADGGVDKALALGIIRQESSFDTATVSPAGARGLMQLMPGTAAQVAQKLGTQAPPASLTADPELNIKLGVTYLRGLLDRFAGYVPFAIAGYNAGPGRVAEWLTLNGDPREAAGAIVDWIELIPINETRNYVQRVIENQAVYAALDGGAGHVLAKAAAP